MNPTPHLTEAEKDALILRQQKRIKLPPAKPEVYCWGASKALVTRDPPKGG
jgi:hypothetical protein